MDFFTLVVPNVIVNGRTRKDHFANNKGKNLILNLWDKKKSKPFYL